MHEDLVKRLREKAGAFDYDGRPDIACDYEQAADAIEKLSGRDTNVPRWIPVTERLPDAEPGDVSERVLVTDGKDVAIVEWFNFEECEPFWGYTGFCKEVTHWMPLPEPPRDPTGEC